MNPSNSKVVWFSQSARSAFGAIGMALMLMSPGLVAPARCQSISNFSARIDLVPGGNYIVGFTVPGTTPTPVLLRAVGPSLATLGITSPVATPRMEIFDSNGHPVFFFYIISPNSGVVTATSVEPQSPFESSIFASVGAFPLTGGETLGAGYNFSYFPPGSYTVKINDDSGRGGTVLFEVYLLPGIPDNAGGIYTGTVIVGVQ